MQAHLSFWRRQFSLFGCWIVAFCIVVGDTQAANAVSEVPAVQADPVQPDIAARQQQTLVKLFGVGAGQLDSYGTAVLISSEAVSYTHLTLPTIYSV